MKKFKNIIYEKEGSIARLILNRPEKLNAITTVMMDEIESAISRAEEDDEVKVLILKGAGRAFCSGYDLVWGANKLHYRMKETRPGEKLIENPSQRVRLQIDRRIMEIMRHLFLCTKVTIAQAHGHCVAMGLLLAEKCDFIIGADDCKFGLPEERLMFGGVMITPMLVFRVGLTKALELSITGKSIDGKEAARINLINRAVPADSLESEVEELAHAIALYPRDGLAIGVAARHTVYDMLGITQCVTTGTLTHSLMTYIDFQGGEYNFPKEIAEKGVKAASREKLDYCKALDK